MPEEIAQIHKNDLADLSGIDKKRLEKLAEDGQIPQPENGLFPLETTLRALFKYLQNTTGGAGKAAELVAQRARLTAHKADLAAIELARAQGDTYNAAAVSAQFEAMVTETRQRILSFPSKFASQFVGVETVNEAHKRLKALSVATAKHLAEPVENEKPARTPKPKKSG